MQPFQRRQVHAWPLFVSFTAGVLVLTSCASPGPPRPPSLGIPSPVSDLTATRSGNVVLLRFSVPNRTTDGQPQRASTLTGTLCRQLGSGGVCLPIDTRETRAPLLVPSASPAPSMTWTDELPADLLSGAPRAIAYRVEIRNPSGHSAGPSDSVYAAAGAAPLPVANLRAEGMRLGVKLGWTPAPDAGEILLQRTDLEAAAAATQSAGDQDAEMPTPSRGRREKTIGRTRKALRRSSTTPGLVLLQAAPGNPSATETVDKEIVENKPYRYSATRRQIVQVGGRTLTLQSASSAEVTATWRDVYPPSSPLGLTALGYKAALPGKAYAEPGNGSGEPGRQQFAVDLVWQPVNDTRLSGYIVYRQTLDTAGRASGTRLRLTPEPVPTPGYHDATAQPGQRYRYSVAAIDPKGNESPAAETIADPAAPPVP